jgi:hypothetical protein
MDKKSIIFQYNAFSYTALRDTYRKGIREPFRILSCLFIYPFLKIQIITAKYRFDQYLPEALKTIDGRTIYNT